MLSLLRAGVLVLVVAACGEPAAPVEFVPAATARPAPAATPRATPKPAPAEAYYENCAAVRAAGKAPLRRGQPGYRSALDRDNDGVACE